ncbi:MAG: MFS transporter, partial [Armatimonadetes bacterium]|nr:MFS transporter [Armatimonadota bacterium]
MNRRRQVAVISLIVLFDLLGFGLIIPQLGVYAKLYQASAATQGLLIASYSMMQFLFAPLLGRWSDRIGRRPVLIISLLTSLLGHLLFAMSRDLRLLFLSR